MKCIMKPYLQSIMSKTIAIIPARGGSKRLPQKNILNLNAIPLIAYSILYAKKHDFLHDVYVSTDCENIAKFAIQYGAKVIHRPADLSGDYEPTVTALKHVLQTIKANNNDNVVLLQPTNPLRPLHLLVDAYNIFINNNLESLFTVSRDEHKLGKISNNTFIPFNYKIGQRSQDLEPLYFENGLLYITQAKHIINNTIITNDAFPYIDNSPYSKIDIDTQDDFDYAEYLINKHNYKL